MILACSNSLFTTISNAVLSKFYLGETFKFNPDGMCLLLISLGGALASSQVPSNSWEDELWSKSAKIYEKISGYNSFIYFTLIKVTIVAKLCYLKKVKRLLQGFYSNTFRNI